MKAAGTAPTASVGPNNSRTSITRIGAPVRPTKFVRKGTTSRQTVASLTAIERDHQPEIFASGSSHLPPTAPPNLSQNGTAVNYRRSAVPTVLPHPSSFSFGHFDNIRHPVTVGTSYIQNYGAQERAAVMSRPIHSQPRPVSSARTGRVSVRDTQQKPCVNGKPSMSASSDHANALPTAVTVSSKSDDNPNDAPFEIAVRCKDESLSTDELKQWVFTRVGCIGYEVLNKHLVQASCISNATLEYTTLQTCMKIQKSVEAIELQQNVRLGASNKEPYHPKAFILDWCCSESSSKRLLKVDAAFSDKRQLIPYHDFPLMQVNVGALLGNGGFARAFGFPDDNVNFNVILQRSVLRVEFEHDRKSMDVFARIENKAYKISIFYDIIRRVSANLVFNKQKDVKELLLYIDLKCPPNVRVSNGHPHGNFKRRVLEFGDCTKNIIGNSSTWQLRFPVSARAHPMADIWELLTRLQARISGVDIWFGKIETFPVGEMLAFDTIDEALSNRFGHLKKEKDKFAIFYALKAIWSRGYFAQCEVTNEFLEAVDDATDESDSPIQNRRAATVASLTIATDTLLQLASAFDDGAKVCLHLAFREYLRIRQAEQGSDRFTFNDKSLVAVRKAIVMPSRVLFLAPERMLTNRVLRRYGHDPALRIVFRDDNMRKLFYNENDGSNEIIDQIMADSLRSGMTICGRKFEYLACSNSQMRDHSCYMFAKTDENTHSARYIREHLGKFDNCGTVSKVMARMGQCLTQAYATIPPTTFTLDSDIMSNIKYPGVSNESYNFTDGIGRIAETEVAKVFKSLELNYGIKVKSPLPSALQIRFKGYKGMLALDPRLDSGQHKVVFRKSMHKFEASATTTKLEIVKWSQPSDVCLNRVLIMVLEMACGVGTPACDKMKSAIHGLLEKQLRDCVDMLITEDKALLTLNKQTTIKLRFLKKYPRFPVTSEPFFKNLLRAVCLDEIQHLKKLNIAIPSDCGRTMFGVVDEFGVLGKNEVFVQYSSDMRKPGKQLRTHEGPVLVTKNPLSVPGDIRMLTAVYRPQLSHLVDVIVFPANPSFGRPLPDQISGSDLDGDEYSVIFHTDIFIPQNVGAFEYPKAPPVVKRIKPTEEHMIDFLALYVKNDNIGRVANALLAAVDKVGYGNPLVDGLARKHSDAVDFAKSGESASLTREELDGGDDNGSPDYFDHARLSYRSTRLVGELCRKVKLVSEAVALAEVTALSNQSAISSYFPKLSNYAVPFEAFIPKAIENRDIYANRIRALLDLYGIVDETQLLSGHVSSLKNRIDSMEKEKFNFMTTEKVIEQSVKHLWKAFRTEFFAEFGGKYGHHLDDDDNYDPDWEPSPPMIAKATAWYCVTYDCAKHGNQSGFYGFAWIVGDVLLAKLKDEFDDDSLARSLAGLSLTAKRPILNKFRFMDVHEGVLIFNKLAEFPSSWFSPLLTVLMNEYAKSKFMHLVVTVIHILSLGDNVLKKGSKKFDQLDVATLFLAYSLQQGLLSASDVTQDESKLNNETLLANHFLDFLLFLASNDFRTDFVGVLAEKCKRKWNGLSFSMPKFINLSLHKFALKALLQIAYSGDFECLFANGSSAGRSDWDFAETGMIHIKIGCFPPAEIHRARERLLFLTGCDEIHIRELQTNRHVYAVCGSGTIQARALLRDYLQADANLLANAIYDTAAIHELDRAMMETDY